MIALPFISTVLISLATAWFVWTITKLLGDPRSENSGWSLLELERRQRIRSADPTYSRFEPLVDELAAINANFYDSGQREEFERILRLSDEPAPWKPEEYRACKQIEGIIAALVVGVIAFVFGGAVVGCLGAVAVLFVYVYQAQNGLQQSALQRATSIKRRLPFAVDLAALMLEAGASFLDALKTVVRENSGHPLSTELGQVLRNIEMGQPRREALYAFQQSLDDQDITDLVVSINKGEELGTPLSTIMRNQADEMRLKRSQWGEAAAAEAEVRMTFPSMVVAIACMLLILAPFALSLLRNAF